MLSVKTWTLLDAVGACELSINSSVRQNERRAHIQAYQYWCSRANKHPMPRILDCQDMKQARFAERLVLIELGHGNAKDSISIIGRDLESDAQSYKSIMSVILDALTGITQLVVSNKSPVSFEAMISLGLSDSIQYYSRGIMLPLSDRERELSHIMAVFNWRGSNADATVPSRAR